MKKIIAKTYKIGRFAVSVFSNEIVIVIIGKNKVHIKTIRFRGQRFKKQHLSLPRKSVRLPWMNLLYHKKPPENRKKLAFAIGISLVLAILIFSVYPRNESPDNTMQQDDIAKNKLLTSTHTDYSTPRKKKRLVIHEHIVKQGDNLSKIAKQYGVSVDTISGTNNLKSCHLIRVGLRLKIPNKDGILYKMKKGSSLVSVAKRYKVSLQKIIDENNLKNPDFVASNTVLFVPDAKPLNVFSGFLWPTRSRRITCGYGWRRNPFSRRFTEFHQGLDIRANYEWIRASKYGKITYTGWMGGYGKAIIIAHPGGWKTLYAHLSRIIVRRGQYVKQGQTIARSGNTGRSTGAHLHFEILKNGRHRNPYRYLQRTRNRR